MQGIWWPDDVGGAHIHAMKHVQALEYAIGACEQHRVALQAGGNIGLWPKRLSEAFDVVYTFEPDAISRECLKANVADNVVVSDCALGAEFGRCTIKHRGLGSHRVVDVVKGHETDIIPIDSLELDNLDLLQLDVEGYEWHALMGGIQTIEDCHPVIHLELRGFTQKYGQTDDAVRQLLASLGYRLVKKQPGNDFVYAWHQ